MAYISIEPIAFYSGNALPKIKLKSGTEASYYSNNILYPVHSGIQLILLYRISVLVLVKFFGDIEHVMNQFCC